MSKKFVSLYRFVFNVNFIVSARGLVKGSAFRRSKRYAFRGVALLILSVCPVAHGALRTWDGGGGDNFWMTPANWSLDTAPAAGDDLLFPSGAARLINSNNFPIGTTFHSITFSGGGYELWGSVITLSGGITNLSGINTTKIPISLANNQIFAASDGALLTQNDIDTAGRILSFLVSGTAEVQVYSPISGAGGISKIGVGALTINANDSYLGSTEILEGRMILGHSNALGSATSGTTVAAGASVEVSGNNVVPEPLTLAGKLRGALSGTSAAGWSGPITVVSNTANLDVTINSPLTVSGKISGSGSVTKVSNGILRLTADNTYTGQTTNKEGTLIVDGYQPVSSVTIGLAGYLKGTGTVGVVTCEQSFSGGNPKISPGDLGLGILTTSNLFLSAVTHPAFRINGTNAGAGYGQIRVHGSVDVTDATLELPFDPAFVPVLGNTFVIIDNDGNDPVVGEFRFMPEGTVFNGGGYPFQISYHGGTGNDVVLTRVGSAVRFGSISLQPDYSVFLHVTGGVYSLSYTMQATTNLLSANQWSNIGNGVADFNGVFNFVDADAPLFPMRFYRVVSP